MSPLVRRLAPVVSIAALLAACTMHQTNGLPEGDVGGGAPAKQPAAQSSDQSGGGSSSDTTTSSDAGPGDASPKQPAADTGPAAPTVPTVTGFTLIDADTDQPVANFDPIPEGTTLTLANLPANLNIRANVVTPTGTTVGSVVFDFDGTANFHTEGMAPYALAGDTNGDYPPLDPPLAATAHTVTATPYSDAAGAGTAFTAKTLNFTAQ